MPLPHYPSRCTSETHEPDPSCGSQPEQQGFREGPRGHIRPSLCPLGETMHTRRYVCPAVRCALGPCVAHALVSGEVSRGGKGESWRAKPQLTRSGLPTNTALQRFDLQSLHGKPQTVTILLSPHSASSPGFDEQRLRAEPRTFGLSLTLDGEGAATGGYPSGGHRDAFWYRKDTRSGDDDSVAVRFLPRGN